MSLLVGHQHRGGQELSFPLHEGTHSVLHIIGIQKYPPKDQMNQGTGTKEVAESVSPNKQRIL